ncbi:tetratricopeptide repeat-containing sensor histidine kinase [Phaeocystidibacter luteus]|uniref:Tetratricopeptide repeat protein n=1 Tax=Phaeocystidibacter luteus TaxID=911197 RepID=A0A6N6RL81_9FLAO|nr:tetratricopeptide repeat-containing sensor histidine kinase [Phaeocystidibacter luteus]KAB2813941.1 tetratricopeptide repeat protein [Phaeocystidibacter luteus]
MHLRHLNRLALLLLFSTSVTAQNLDSTAVWETLQSSLGVVYAHPDSAMEMVEQAMASAYALDEPVLIARSFNFKGIVHDVKGQREAALAAYAIAKSKADSLGEERLYASAVNNIGLIQWQQGDYVNAVLNFQESLELFEELGVDVGVANTLNNIGLIYTEQKRLEEGLEYFRRAQKEFKDLDDTYGRSAAYMNISRIYEETNVLDSAWKYIDLTLTLKRELNDPRGISMCYANIGIIADKSGMLDSSIHSYEMALDIDREYGFQSYMAQHLSALGNRYERAGRKSEAEALFLEALELAQKEEELKTLWGIHSRLSELYADMEQFQKAYYHAQLYASLYQQWRDEESEEEIIALQEKFDVARKDLDLAEEREGRALDQIRLQSRTQWIIYLSIAAGLLVVLIVVIVRRLEKRRQRLAEEHALQEQLQETQHESELHQQREGISRDLHDSIGSQLTFLSSTLKNLTWALRNQNKPSSNTLDRLEEVSGIAQKTVSDLRDTVWAMNRSDLTVAEILLRLENGIVQFREAFDGIEVQFSTQGDDFEKIEAAKAMAIYRILQEALTNIRKHSDASNVKVSATKSGVAWVWKISDDGRGFDLSSKSASNGIENMRLRAEGAKLLFQIDSKSGSGTTIEIRESD